MKVVKEVNSTPRNKFNFYLIKVILANFKGPIPSYLYAFNRVEMVSMGNSKASPIQFPRAAKNAIFTLLLESLYLICRYLALLMSLLKYNFNNFYKISHFFTNLYIY
jgi:hypothetical protein